VSDSERDRLHAQIVKDDNRYPADGEWYAAEARTMTARNTDVVAQRIVALFARLQAERLLDDTTLILTADHGRMFERGRFWYGFHADEEVARVPMVVFGPGISGVDDGARETIDITRTIVEAFGGEVPSGSRAVSMLAPADKPYTITVTRPSVRNHEAFVALYRGGRKYVCNVAPAGDGACVEMDPALRDTLAQGPAVLAAIRAPVREALRELGLRADDLHPSYQALLAGSAQTDAAR
jgi:arylsulfatase A-like enzyme